MLAPMAGVTDRPFRQMCKQMGAGLVVSEMLSSNPKVWHTEKSRMRMDHTGEHGIRSVQIAGSDPFLMAEAAQFNVSNGAQIIDINMGCPAKKVNKKLAGSALLQYPSTVESIIKAVVNAVDVPVTLKIRTGWDPDNRNGVRIAEIAQAAGIVSLAVHGRTRACGYKNTVEYDTIRDIKQSVSIPVFANGDITDARKAVEVMQYTGADGVLIGRAAQGRPWIFREVTHYLNTGECLDEPALDEVQNILIRHLHALYEFYGEFAGVRIARKHVGWYLQYQQGGDFRKQFNQLECPVTQQQAVEQFFRDRMKEKELAA